MSLEAKIQALRNELPKIFNDVAKQFEKEVIATAQTNMEIRSIAEIKASKKRVNGKAIGIQSNILGIRSKTGLNSQWKATVVGNTIEVDNFAKYALAQEFGYAPNNLKPRPFAKPTFEDLKKDGIKKQLEATVFLRMVKAWNNA